MFYLKIFLFTVVYFCCVKSSDVNVNSNQKSESTKRNSRRNNYNHPPSAEIYTPIAIPVDVVYEEGNRKDKSIKINELNVELTTTTFKYDNESNTELSTTESTNQHKLKSTDINDNKSSDALRNNEESVTLNASFKVNTEVEGNMKKDKNHISHSETEIKIPVAVIYDEQPDLLSHEKVSSFEKRKPKPRQQRNQRKNLEAAHANMQNKNDGENRTNAGPKFNKRVRERAPVVPIVQSENYVYSHTGNFHYSYEGGDGTKAYERGVMRSLDTNVGASVVGSFSYIGKDGNDYGLTYTADENGYRPVGAHLPTPPPIPPAIARALKYLATKTTPEPVTESTKTIHLL